MPEKKIWPALYKFIERNLKPRLVVEFAGIEPTLPARAGITSL